MRCRTIARALAALVPLAGGCSGNRLVLQPIIDTPSPESDAYPYAGLTSLVLRAVSGGDEVSVSVPIGEPLALDDVPFSDDVVFDLSGLAGDAESAYGRTCAAEVTPESLADQEIHLYMSRIVKWADGPSIDGLQAGDIQAYTLPDGRAAFVSAWPSSMTVRFDPQLGRFVDVEMPSPLEPRLGSVLAPLADGRALLVGGVDAANEDQPEGVPVVEVVDLRPPGLGLGPAGPLESGPGPRLRNHAAAALVDDSVMGSVVVVGGEEQDGSGAEFSPATRTGWLFQFGEGGGLDPPRRLEAEAAFARAGHTMTRLGDEVGADVLIVGGRDEAGAPVAQAELYRPLRESFEVVEGAVLVVPRWGHTAVRLPGGSVLIIGGFTRELDQDVPVSTLELYDPVQGRFGVAGDLPASAGLTEINVANLPDGRLLLAGGLDATGEPVATAFIARLDSLNGRVRVSPTDSLAVGRSGHGAALLCDGTVLLVGGSDDTSAPGSERYNPPSTGRR